MKTILFALIFVPFLGACKVNKYAKNNKQIRKAAIKKDTVFTTFTALSYIEMFKSIAIDEMKNNGIPASITLAQGLLESGTGNSDLARIANNHFGIKCNANWQGKTYFKDDDQINDCFRVYNDANESYRDHSAFLKRDRYKFLFSLAKSDYKGWANGLKKAGYATNPKYPEILITIIEKYQLNRFDVLEGEEFADNQTKTPVTDSPIANPPLTEPKVMTQSVAGRQAVVSPAEQPAKSTSVASAPVDNTTVSIYVVKKGDTLYNISKRFNLTVEELKKLNGLSNTNIKLGQNLMVIK